jgi:hypothetical protein
MPSMSYCKFENTLNELEQCMTAIEEARRPADLDQSSHEDDAMHDLQLMCQEFIWEYDRLFPQQK